MMNTCFVPSRLCVLVFHAGGKSIIWRMRYRLIAL